MFDIDLSSLIDRMDGISSGHGSTDFQPLLGHQRAGKQ